MVPRSRAPSNPRSAPSRLSNLGRPETPPCRCPPRYCEQLVSSLQQGALTGAAGWLSGLQRLRFQVAPRKQKAEWRASCLSGGSRDAWTRLPEGQGGRAQGEVLSPAGPCRGGHAPPPPPPSRQQGERTHPRDGTSLHCGVLSLLSRLASPEVGTRGRRRASQGTEPAGPQIQILALGPSTTPGGLDQGRASAYLRGQVPLPVAPWPPSRSAASAWWGVPPCLGLPAPR